MVGKGGGREGGREGGRREERKEGVKREGGKEERGHYKNNFCICGFTSYCSVRCVNIPHTICVDLYDQPHVP